MSNSNNYRITVYENHDSTIVFESNLFKTMKNNVDNKVKMIL